MDDSLPSIMRHSEGCNSIPRWMIMEVCLQSDMLQLANPQAPLEAKQRQSKGIVLACLPLTGAARSKLVEQGSKADPARKTAR